MAEPEFFPYILLSAVNIAAVYSTKLCFWQQKNSGSGEEIRKQHLQCAKKAGIVGAVGVYGRMAAGRSNRHQNTIYLYQSGAADERSKQSSGRY